MLRRGCLAALTVAVAVLGVVAPASAHVSVDPSEAPQGSFACGWTFCLLGSQYCQRVTDDTGGADGWSCLPLPDGCIDPSCDCLADEPCGSICEAGPDGALVVTCPGG